MQNSHGYCTVRILQYPFVFDRMQLSRSGVEDHFLILFWRNTVQFFEYANKIINILISAGRRDGADGEGRRIDQCNGTAYTDLVDVIGQRYFYLFFE